MDEVEKEQLKNRALEPVAVSLLTGGSDRPYVFGLTTALVADGVSVDLIGSDELAFSEFRDLQRLNFLNLRGSSDARASRLEKVARILRYYGKLIRYAALAKPRLFHILWNNKFETFDRTVLMLYYKSLRKKVVHTVHNVNMRKRDGKDSFLNRLTLRIQYKLCDHLFVHTAKMKSDLASDFDISENRITVIPFGINNSLPSTSLTTNDARRKLGIRTSAKVILFFGRITPYKGLDYLIPAFRDLQASDSDYCLVIAGRVDRCESYWHSIRTELDDAIRDGQAIVQDTFIPDRDAEVYFKAADLFVLPYRDIYQSGVLFTGQRFGTPVVAADVGSFQEDIIEDKTGLLFRPGDKADLAETMKRYFDGDLYANLEKHRQEISKQVAQKHSWESMSKATIDVYARLLGTPKDVLQSGQQCSDGSCSATISS